ncbi:glycoside hydrolase family 95 protein [Adhaeribacter rhizoryzae]|uniref:Glycoside hydrolase family 95 protein n=1 Tax=Adhaeribacter rhizoryzae TaxID=2607907 RepID=A0A5M6D0B5_9BACT|nr:glycoside hydrolase N-terminal domain-containing protein [Adhaeribacter rhizoryzae]KAA5540894.1 glycoside hydrolase family 95 protein [Adhaeribacter rhizoryzae]
MTKLKKSGILTFFLSVFTLASGFSQQTQKPDLKLWYTQPAVKWTDALPIGNGRLGAMVFAGVAQDRIQFNEETLWTGEPRNHNREGAAAYLPEIRKLLAESKQAEAEKLATEKFMGLKSSEGQREVWFREMRALKGLDSNPALANYDDSQWKTFEVPTYEGWESAGLEGLDGAVWFRTSFDLPTNWKGKNLVLDLNRIRDQDFTYVNGKLVGTTDGTESRKYIIPKEVLQPGKNILAIQVLNYFAKGGIAGYKDTSRPIAVYPEGESAPKGISLVKTWKYKIQNDEPPAVPRFQADYQPFGDLYLNFSGHDNAQNYRRELDLTQAISRTTYTVGNVQFTREYLVSQPNQVIAIHLTASKPGSLSFQTSLSSPHKKSATRRLDNHTLALNLQVRNGALKGESYLRVVTTKGQANVTEDKITVSNADAVTLYLTAGTNYKNYKDITGDPAAACKSALASIQGKNYEQIRQAHIREYQSYFNTLTINLGRSENEKLPTDKRIEQFANSADPALTALYLQYGRYLLISSSRPGSQPANLQGIWNDLLTPPWGSKYTTNINAEMNYWPAEALNLSPLHEPLFGMIAELAEAGRQTAKIHYNAPGWVLHHNTDLWRGTAPINASNHGIWVTGGAWLSQHLWERYLYAQDQEFLKQEAYPIMKEAARFFNNFLVKDPKTGWLISTPSNSPEQGGLVAGPTMDHQLIRALFQSTIQASEILKMDKSLRDSLKTKYSQIAPNQIGKHGQLQEWLEDVDDPKNKHRHVSHLWGVHPGNEINWDQTPDLMKAARQSLIFRGDEGTGWSLAWKINFWARFKDGNHAYKMVKMLISPAAKGGGSYVNLFDAHPPFQIDGNFGGAAGIGEMLVQSHTGIIDLLPALPSELPIGEINGICARGGFDLNLKWNNGKLQALEVLSKAGAPCQLRYGDKTIRFKTKKGQRYKLDANLKRN